MASRKAGRHANSASSIPEAELGRLREYIEPYPTFPVPSEARLTGFGVPVWAIIGYLQHAVNNDLSAVVRDYDLPLPAVYAAVAYYEIDARIRVNHH